VVVGEQCVDDNCDYRTEAEAELAGNLEDGSPLTLFRLPGRTICPIAQSTAISQIVYIQPEFPSDMHQPHIATLMTHRLVLPTLSDMVAQNAISAHSPHESSANARIGIDQPTSEFEERIAVGRRKGGSGQYDWQPDQLCHFNGFRTYRFPTQP
jgi:hypothetical protein